LHGQRTEGLGVIDREGEDGELFRVTDMERTLIDIVVRPIYSGGATQILEAYRLARNIVSIKKLVTYLKKMNYVYPYHQAIGFYLNKAGVYKESDMKQLRTLGLKYDFYLEHNMDDPGYSKEWRIFFPKDL
jgi:predicted transcriptional regulator of viral defense system